MGAILTPALIERKTRRQASAAFGIQLQRIRREHVDRFASALRIFWRRQAQRVVERARGRKQLYLDPDDLLPPVEDVELALISRRYVMGVLEASWDTYNQAAGVVVDFRLTDPAVRAAIRKLEVRMVNTNDITRAAVREVLEVGERLGWSIDKIVRGDPALGIRGLRDTVEMTYRNRDRAVARTELGIAQQEAAVGRYEHAGVEKVLCLDDGFPNSHWVCVELGNNNRGTVVSLEWAEERPLQHPNCVRAYAPYFGDAEPEDPDYPVWGG